MFKHLPTVVPGYDQPFPDIFILPLTFSQLFNPSYDPAQTRIHRCFFCSGFCCFEVYSALGGWVWVRMDAIIVCRARFWFPVRFHRPPSTKVDRGRWNRTGLSLFGFIQGGQGSRQGCGTGHAGGDAGGYPVHQKSKMLRTRIDQNSSFSRASPLKVFFLLLWARSARDPRFLVIFYVFYSDSGTS